MHNPMDHANNIIRTQPCSLGDHFMLRIISILFCGLFTCIGGTHSAYAQRTGDPEKDAQMADRRVKRTGNVLKIAADAPDRYTVKRGDTLWDISSRYLTDPWRWPELWRGNKEQIKDPHWIYPGDLLVLDRTTGTLSVERGETHSKVNAPLRLSPTEHIEVEEKAIPLIAANVMGPFLSRPLVLDARVVDGKIEESEVLRNAPKIIGGADGLHTSVKQKADWLWSLSKLTLPHGMVRVMLAEQLYRAHSVICNHPYHRE